MKDGYVYCPVCGKTLEAVNIEDVENGDDDGYLFVHDDIAHTDSDFDALNTGLQ